MHGLYGLLVSDRDKLEWILGGIEVHELVILIPIFAVQIFHIFIILLEIWGYKNHIGVNGCRLC